MCGAFRTRRRPTGGSKTRAASENGAASRNGAFNKHRVLCKNDALDSSGARQNAATALQRRAKPNGPSAGHTLDTCAHYFQPAKPMNNGIARVAVLLAMVGWSLIAPQPAEAQFGGSLIVTVTSPASGSTVSGTVSVTASVSGIGALTVRGVQFRLDGSNLGAEDTTAPYSVPWDTTTAGNGSHTLTAVARDSLGVLWTSDPVTVTVFNDTTPPAVSITSPASGTIVAGTISVTANASDNVGVVGVQFLLDGANVGAEVTAAPYSAPWDTTTASRGSHTLTAVARDAAGNRTTSAPVSVTVVNASPIVLENQQPGSGNWQMLLSGFQPADDTAKQIKGYASATSVNKGESITFHVTVTPAQSYTMDVYRMGWCQGLLGRLMQSIGPLQGVEQPACPVDAGTGLIECDWTASYTLTVPPSWTSGMFLVMLTNAQGYQNYIPFVVRDDARRADLLFQQAVTTYQAYNNYPDDCPSSINCPTDTGKSLYAYNSHGANTVTGTPRAVKVSWNRPYAVRGGGQLFEWEVYFVRWLERSGYDVKYSTNVDTHENSARLLESKVFLSVGHDGFWSKPMYDGVQQARDAGVHLGFFGASAVFSQVRFEASPLTLAADRVMVYYKERSMDPVQGPTTTILWRDPFLNRPEQQLIGVQFTGEIAYDPMNQPPYVVANSSSWVYAGTGLADGTSIPRILGYQMDASMSSFPLPTSVAGTYQILSQSPFTDSGATVIANSSIYQAPSGAWVFGAGTTSWAWGLVDDGDGFVDPRIQQTTANLLQRFGASPSP